MSAHDVGLVRRPLDNLCPACRRPLTSRLGIAATAFAAAEAVYGVTLPELLGQGRSRHLVKARALVAWTLRTLGEAVSYPIIGRMLGGRDPTTIMNLHQKAIRLRLTDTEFALACRALEIADQTEASHGEHC